MFCVNSSATQPTPPMSANLAAVVTAKPAARVGSFLSRFREEKSGSTAIMFALLIAPVMILTGMAVDFSRMLTVKSRMQTALDAAALAGSRAAQTTSTNVTIVAQSAASTYYNAIPMPFVASKTLSNVSTDSTQTNFSWTATSWVKTPFLSMAGMLNSKSSDSAAPSGCSNGWWTCQKVVATASTTIAAGGNNTGYSIETSFMLDITGSMAGTKISDLKSAANDAVDILIWSDQTKYTSRVAITPFAQDVRLPSAATFQLATGAAPVNASKYYNGYPFRQYNTQYCVAERPGTNKYTDAAPGSGNYVMSAWLYTGWGSTCDVPSSAVATPLTADKTALHNLINSLQPSGGTAGHLGTAWAWYMLSPNWKSLWPTANQAGEYDSAYNVNTKTGNPKDIKLKKIAVLMTDGDYNFEYNSAGVPTTFGGSPVNDTSSNQATALCTNMKAKGIEVYTVAFGTGLSSSAQTLLTNCATDTSHFYNATTGDALKAAFRDIALKISSLRITG